MYLFESNLKHKHFLRGEKNMILTMYNVECGVNAMNWEDYYSLSMYCVHNVHMSFIDVFEYLYRKQVDVNKYMYNVLFILHHSHESS